MRLLGFLVLLIHLFAVDAIAVTVTSYKHFSTSIGYQDYTTRTDLTESQKLALDNYKSTAVYELIQGYLVDSEKYKDESVFVINSQHKIEKRNSTILGEFSDEIQNAIYNSPILPGGLYLFRGQSDIQLGIGESFKRKGFTSTSLNPNEANKFNRGSLLYIRIPPNGFPGILTGRWEEEVLLPFGTTFLIIDRKMNENGNSRILVEPCFKKCRQIDDLRREVGEW